MGEPKACSQVPGAPATVMVDDAPTNDGLNSQGHGLYPSHNLVDKCADLTMQVEQLSSEKKRIKATLQAERALRRQAEKPQVQVEQKQGMMASALQSSYCDASEAEQRAALKQLKEERQARLKLEAEVKRCIAEMKNEDGIRLSCATGNDLCEELEQLHGVSRRLSAGLEDERARRRKAEASLDEMMAELAHMEKSRANVEIETKELRSRLRSQMEIKGQLDAVKEQTRREIDIVMRRARGEIDEECRQRMKAEGALDEVLKEITENELARRKAEVAHREACRSLDSERKVRKRVEEERQNLEGVAREHHRRRSQAEAANSQLRAEVEALRKECEHLRHSLNDERQQRETTEAAWKETARRLHGERAMYACWMKKHKELQGKGCQEIEEVAQHDADTNWMDQSMVASMVPRRSRQLPKLEKADPQTMGTLGMALPLSAESEWDAARKTTNSPSMVLGSGMMSFDSSKANCQWHVASDPRSVDYGVVECRHASRFGGTAFTLGSEDIATAQQAISQVPAYICHGHPTRSHRFRWLRHLSPLGPAKWMLNHRGDVAYHTGKVLQNFWTWVIAVGVVAGTVGLGDGGNEDREKSGSGLMMGQPQLMSPREYNIRGVGTTVYGADSFMG